MGIAFAIEKASARRPSIYASAFFVGVAVSQGRLSDFMTYYVLWTPPKYSLINAVASFPFFKLVPRALFGQNGTAEIDRAYGVAVFDDGSTIVAGATAGDWAADNLGEQDFAASKIDVNGTLLWKWQVNEFCGICACLVG